MQQGIIRQEFGRTALPIFVQANQKFSSILVATTNKLVTTVTTNTSQGTYNSKIFKKM